MAKDKKALSDLEAELAALEAELASLEGKKATKKKPAPAKPAEAAPAGEAATETEPAKPKGLFGLKMPKRKGASDAPAPSSAAATPAPAPAASGPEPSTVAPSAPVAALPKGDMTHWRHESGAWVRTVPSFEGPVMRRVLDDEGNVVREESATRADLDAVTGVKAERGVAKLLGGGMGKLKGFRFGKRGGDE